MDYAIYLKAAKLERVAAFEHREHAAMFAASIWHGAPVVKWRGRVVVNGLKQRDLVDAEGQHRPVVEAMLKRETEIRADMRREMADMGFEQ